MDNAPTDMIYVCTPHRLASIAITIGWFAHCNQSRMYAQLSPSEYGCLQIPGVSRGEKGEQRRSNVYEPIESSLVRAAAVAAAAAAAAVVVALLYCVGRK